MYKKKPVGILKHMDFIILNCFALCLAIFIAYKIVSYQFEKIIIFYVFAQIFAICSIGSFKNVLKKTWYQDILMCAKHAGFVTIIVIVILYACKLGEYQSRLQMGIICVLHFVFSYCFRHVNKKVIIKKKKISSSILVVTTADRAQHVVEVIQGNKITGICVIDEDKVGCEYGGVSVVTNKDELLNYVCRNWVDEVFFDLGSSYVRPDDEIHYALLSMGIATKVKIYRKDDNYEWDKTIEKFGPYMVVTRSSKMASSSQLLLKRIMDIFGGIVGTILTAFLFIFIAPIIYIKSPGPIFFAQERIGYNGKRFKMYKFRSMVMNADELKKKYMDQNRVGDGMMFKLDWDPRVIGNIEVNGKKKTGIGEFIRKTSLDEFPQFINVLKGDMSLVGTRPPTIDEWEKYDLHHRARMATRPGITGMWQVSGRSDITDFEEVVRLDREYISKWSVWLDMKILAKTLFTVVKREGSM